MLTQVTHTEYNAAGRISAVRDPRGAADDKTYSYDEATTTMQLSSSRLSAPITQRFDARGQRRELVDATGTTSFSYDALGRITSVAAPQTGTVGYAYSPRGERTQLSYPDGTAISYTYAADGQLQAVEQGATTLATYAYDSAGRLQTLTRANGAVTSYGYDGADRLTDLHTTVLTTTLSRFQYTLDRAGLRTGATETLTATRSISYSYDGLQRLTGATESGATTNSYAYGYDLAGNRTSATVNGVTTTRSYDAANQVLGWSYDAAGNLLNDGTTTRSYDALGRMTSAGSTSYTSNGDGVLVQAVATTYTQDLAASLSQVLSDGSATYLYGRERLRAVNGPWYLGDALGSVRLTLNDAGAPLARAWYDPWGQAQGGIIAPFGFTGELQESTGPVYLRARWYDPAQGTLLGRDPFAGVPEQPYSLHPFQYGYSSPLNYADPTGKLAIFVGGRGSEERGENPFDPDRMVSVWEMGRRFAPFIRGSVIIASWNARSTIRSALTPFADLCSTEPIILVGHSYGATTVMDVADEMTNVQITLIATMDIVNMGDLSHRKVKANNVIRQMNFQSDNAPTNLARKVALNVPDVVAGAENYTVAGSEHVTLDNEYLDVERKKPNPAWPKIEQAIKALR